MPFRPVQTPRLRLLPLQPAVAGRYQLGIPVYKPNLRCCSWLRTLLASELQTLRQLQQYIPIPCSVGKKAYYHRVYYAPTQGNNCTWSFVTPAFSDLLLLICYPRSSVRSQQAAALLIMDVCCAAGAPVSINYTAQGSVQELGGVPCYITGNSKDAAIVGIYDIFGFSPQVKRST